MASITIFREYSFLLSLYKWRIYVNGKRMGKIGKFRTLSFPLPSGNYEIMVNCPDLPFGYRKKGLHSNLIKIKLEDGKDYKFNLGPHPLFWFEKHYPDWRHPFRVVECLLLLKQDENFQDNITYLQNIGNQIQDELKQFTYHPISLILTIVISLFAMVTNTIYPAIYATGDGVAWGFLFGITNIIGLLNGLNKQLLARGMEYKILLYAAFGALMILFFIPKTYYWQCNLYFLSVLILCFWSYFCYKRWKKDKKGLDEIELLEISFENRM